MVAAIQGHWAGHVGTEQVAFDIYNAPCEWGEPNETPYVAQLADGTTSIIATGILPSGEKVLGLFRYHGQSLTVTEWSETFAAGENFRFEKTSPVPAYAHHYYAEDLVLHWASGEVETFNVRSLRFAKDSYCCDGKVFGACRITSAGCSVTTMSSAYELVENEGTMVNGICSGTSTAPKRKGTFTLRARSWSSACTPK